MTEYDIRKHNNVRAVLRVATAWRQRGLVRTKPAFSLKAESFHWGSIHQVLKTSLLVSRVQTSCYWHPIGRRDSDGGMVAS